jgi:hypothetical protein
MSNGNKNIDEVVEVCVPPISMADEERDLSNGQDIDLAEFADFARSKAGTPGEIGVALDSLQALSEDIDTFSQTGAAPGDLEIHAEAIQEILQILYRVADGEIESYDKPLYADTNTDLVSKTKESEKERDNDKEKEKISKQNMLEVAVDRISGSGNIIAEPKKSDINHIHVQNGTIGNKAVAYHPEGNLYSKGGENKPYILPYSSKSEAEAKHGQNDDIPLSEGDHIQLASPSEEDGFVYLDGFDTEAIKLDKDINKDATILFKITKVKTNIAEAEIKDQSTPSSHNSGSNGFKTPKSTPDSGSSSGGNKKKKSGGIPKVSKGPAGSKNDLLSGKKL